MDLSTDHLGLETIMDVMSVLQVVICGRWLVDFVYEFKLRSTEESEKVVSRNIDIGVLR